MARIKEWCIIEEIQISNTVYTYIGIVIMKKLPLSRGNDDKTKFSQLQMKNKNSEAKCLTNWIVFQRKTKTL